MNRKSRFAGAAVLILTLLATGAAASSAASTATNRDDDDVEVIRLTAKTVQEAAIDLGEEGDSIGDQFVFSEDLYRGGKKVGIDGVVCTIVRLEPMISATSQCVATAELPKGQITAQGLLTDTGDTGEPEAVVLAITGGTGKYKEAQGEVRSVQLSATESRITFKITD
jgi:hypothetical protein